MKSSCLKGLGQDFESDADLSTTASTSEASLREVGGENVKLLLCVRWIRRRVGRRCDLIRVQDSDPRAYSFFDPPGVQCKLLRS